MGAHNGAVDHRVFVVGIGREMLENPLPDAGFGPPAESRWTFPVFGAAHKPALRPLPYPIGRNDPARLDDQAFAAEA
jgi:hypothetical protein